MTTNTKTDYSTIRLPRDFVDTFIEPLKTDKLGFTSSADVVRAGVRELYGKYRQENPKSEVIA